MIRARWQAAGSLSVLALTLCLWLPGSPLSAKEDLPAPPGAAGNRSALGPEARGLAALPSGPDAHSTERAPSDAAAQEDEAASPAGKASPPGAEQGAAPAAPPAAAASADAEQSALPAVNAAIKQALEERLALPGGPGLPRHGEREAIASFYALRDFAPIWWRDGKPVPEAAPVIERLKHAADDGLDVRGFPRSLSLAAAQEIALADIALSDAVVTYGRQASGSRVDPHMISRLIGLEPEVADPAVILALVSSAGAQAGEELRRFNPPQRGYEALREKLIELRHGRSAPGRSVAIPAGPVLRPGMRDPRVPLVRARLNIESAPEEFRQSQAGSADLVYDMKTAEAVADFQKANGLPPSGRLTARTVAALSGRQTSRLEAEILANMERWRWMPRDLGESHIEVNIPDYEAAVIDKGEVIERVRVVTGKEETPTPVFSGTMRYLIVNPAWNVPQSIIRKEMLPRLASDPSYFQRMGYEVFSRGGHLAVRQPPGERNALGRVKFVFPNDFSVYMHDTPMHKLFASTKRAFSHGCVRVDEPFRFAETVLGRANGWSEQRVRKMIGGRERYVYLPKPLPVHLEYFTAYVDQSGGLQLREDVYGYSRRVREALGLERQGS
jgi:murein L,D-transpeptidase YcbB/YkuD